MAAVEFEHFEPIYSAIETPFNEAGVFLNLEHKPDDEIEVYMFGPGDPEDGDTDDAVLVLRLSAAGKRQLQEWLA